MAPPRRLTDRKALLARRARADLERGLFLHEAARQEIEDRTALVNRNFTKPAIVTGFPAVWRDLLPGARLVADDETLELEAASHDLIVHAMALHWADDPVGQLVQCLNALVPDGLFLGVLPGGRTLSELRAALAEAEVEVTGGLSPRVLPMADLRDLGALLQRAGFAMPVTDSVPLEVRYETPFHLMRDLRAMGEANALADRLRHFTRRRVLFRAAERYAAAFGGPDGRVRATFELVFLAGWRPDPSQPRPLRPGSAALRLAEALGTTETPLRD